MASPLTDATSAFSTLLPIFAGSGKTLSTESGSPQANADTQNVIDQATANANNPALTDQLVQNIMRQASEAFAPVQAQSQASGMYNNNTLSLLKNDAQARATQQSADAVLRYRTSQQQIAEAASGKLLAANQSKVSRTASSPAATPLALLGAGLKGVNILDKTGAISGAKKALGFGQNTEGLPDNFSEANAPTSASDAEALIGGGGGAPGDAGIGTGFGSGGIDAGGSFGEAGTSLGGLTQVIGGDSGLLDAAADASLGEAGLLDTAGGAASDAATTGISVGAAAGPTDVLGLDASSLGSDVSGGISDSLNVSDGSIGSQVGAGIGSELAGSQGLDLAGSTLGDVAGQATSDVLGSTAGDIASSAAVDVGGEAIGSAASSIGADVGGAVWIVCTELMKQGRMPKRYWIYGSNKFAGYPEIIKRGYYFYAIPAVRHLRANPNSRLSWFLDKLLNGRAEWIAAQGGLRGASKTVRGFCCTYPPLVLMWLTGLVVREMPDWQVLYRKEQQ